MGCLPPSWGFKRSSTTSSSLKTLEKNENGDVIRKREGKRNKIRGLIEGNLVDLGMRRRFPDGKDVSASAVSRSETGDYVERIGIESECDKELEKEIKLREGSLVRVNVNKYEQMEVKSKLKMPLVDVQNVEVSTESDIYERVQSLEEVTRESKLELSPSLQELWRRREHRKRSNFSEVSIEGMPIYSW